MAAGYRAPICRGWPVEFDGEAPGLIRDFAAFQADIGTFSTDPARLIRECAKVANSGFEVVRNNRLDTAADFQANFAAAQAKSTEYRDHIGNVVTQLSRLGVWYKPSLLDRIWGIDRDATVDAAAVAAGAPIYGVNSLTSYAHGSTSTAFGSGRESTRRLMHAIWIYADGGTFSIGASGTKPGPNRSNAATDAFMDAMTAFVVADLTDVLTRMGWVIGGPQTKKIWLQAFNGEEQTRGIRREGYQAYFSNITFDLKNSNAVTALAALYPGMVIPTDATEGTGLAKQNLMDERAEWAIKVLQEIAYGAISADNVIEDMQSVHVYGAGGSEPRVIGDPDVTKAPIVGECNITKPFDPRVNPRSGNAVRAPAETPLNDNDEAFFFWLPVGEAVTVWLENNPGIIKTIPSNPTAQQVIDTLCSLPGVGDAKSATDGARDIEVINSYNNTTPPMSIYYYPPDGRAFNGFRLYIGHRRDGAGATPSLGSGTDTNNSVSKGGKMPRFRLGHANAHVFQRIRGGALDRGPFMIEFIQWLHDRGYRGFTYHTPFDPRCGITADQTQFWTVAGYEAWLGGGRTRSVHDGGPHMAEEARLYRWFWSHFPRRVKQWGMNR